MAWVGRNVIRILSVGFMALVPALTGCGVLAAPFFLWGQEPMKTIKAEHPYLSDKRVCILVRADMETLFEYQHVQFEVASYVRAALEGGVKGVAVVDPRKVTDYQASTRDWEKLDPAEIGKHFGADRVLDIDLTQYTTREPDSPHLVRGHITALVSVYNAEYPNSEPVYRTEIKTVYPPSSTAAWGTGDRDVRGTTMEAFAQEVAGKFHDRRVKA